MAGSVVPEQARATSWLRTMWDSSINNLRSWAYPYTSPTDTLTRIADAARKGLTAQGISVEQVNPVPPSSGQGSFATQKALINAALTAY